MNTRLEYMYRDGHNYKQFNEVVIAGEITIDQLRPCYYEGQFFVPSEVGLEDLQVFPYRDCDHIWHEILETTRTQDVPTAAVTAKSLFERFQQAAAVEWNTTLVNERMSDMTS